MDRSDLEHLDEAPDPAETTRPAASEPRAGHLGFVAHEIRNPLSTALWTAELLARMPAADRGAARGEKLSAMCLRSVARVRQLVEDHLLAERIDIGGIPLRLEALGLAEALGGLLERRLPDAAPVSTEIDPAVAVEADRALLERALEALVAVAGAERTPVRLAARVSEREVTLTVSGRAADAAALADPVKGSPSDASGRALALPLARRIAAVLGGRLGVGEGGWCLTLPKARAYTPRPSPAASP